MVVFPELGKPVSQITQPFSMFYSKLKPTDYSLTSPIPSPQPAPTLKATEASTTSLPYGHRCPPNEVEGIIIVPSTHTEGEGIIYRDGAS